MISVTLQFADSAAVVAFFSDRALPGAENQKTVADAAAPAPRKPKAEKPAAPDAAASAAAPSASAPAASAADAIAYPVLQKAVFALAAKGDAGKAACKELCGAFKVATFKDLDSGKYAEALAAVNAELAKVAA